tara:strand:- start:705 stop:1817 length:1113 start_codon:yes stop_codon:yes gene_type:complete
MANKRTYWAIEAIGTAAHGAGAGATPALDSFHFVPGVQSVGMTTNFNLDQIFQLGQLEIYQDLEDIPDVELSVEKVLDDTTLMYTRCVCNTANTAPGGYTALFGGQKDLTTIQNNRVDVAFVVNADTDAAIGDDTGDIAAYMSGMYLSSVNFNFAADGYFTESVSLVGNHQKWFVPGAELASSPQDIAPQALQSGDVLRRHNFSFDAIGDVPEPLKTLGGTVDDLRIASISVATDFGREEMFALGNREPYHRYVTFPVEVTCDIEAYVTDAVDMGVNALPNARNVSSNNTIKFDVFDATSGGILSGPGVNPNHNFDLGAKNTLSSVTWNGLSTDGTNATVTYSYRNFNKLSVTSITGGAVIPPNPDGTLD